MKLTARANFFLLLALLALGTVVACSGRHQGWDHEFLEEESPLDGVEPGNIPDHHNSNWKRSSSCKGKHRGWFGNMLRSVGAKAKRAGKRACNTVKKTWKRLEREWKQLDKDDRASGDNKNQRTENRRTGSAGSITKEDLEGMRVRKLKKLLRKAGVEYHGIVDKAELVSALCATIPGCVSHSEMQQAQRHDFPDTRDILRQFDQLQSQMAELEQSDKQTLRSLEELVTKVRLLEQNSSSPKEGMKLVSEIIRKLAAKIKRTEAALTQLEDHGLERISRLEETIAAQARAITRLSHAQAPSTSSNQPLSSLSLCFLISWCVCGLLISGLWINKNQNQHRNPEPEPERNSIPQPQPQPQPDNVDSNPAPAEADRASPTDLNGKQDSCPPKQAMCDKSVERQTLSRITESHPMVRQLQLMGFQDKLTNAKALQSADGDVAAAVILLAEPEDEVFNLKNPPEYSQEEPSPLQELQEMGFDDPEANAKALADANGSLTAALKLLIAVERAKSSGVNEPSAQ
jgi:DNA-binding MarR family transcriptional regulator